MKRKNPNRWATPRIPNKKRRHEGVMTGRFQCKKPNITSVPKEAPKYDKDTEPDWEGKCSICGASPIVPCTGMCGPCTFGEADTVGGNW